MKKSIAIAIVAILVVLIAGWLIARQFRQTARAEGGVQYDITPVRRMDLSDKINVSGNVVLEKNASVYPPYNATVKKILVKPGDTVHKGDLLMVLQLDDADMVNYSSSWKSALEQARSNLAVAQKALERETVLFKAQGTTIDAVENAQSKVRQYQEQVNEYRLKLESLAKNGVENDNSVLIRAPFDADISWIDVKPEETVTTATQLLTLAGDSAVRVEVNVDQGDIGLMKTGLKALISANDQNRTIIQGIVDSYGGTGTTSSGVVTFPVVIKPVTPGKLNNLLKSGMTVDVTILVDSHPNVLAIPSRAVHEENGRTVVQVMNQGRLVTKKVHLGFQSSDQVEVISGLAENEQVAVPVIQAPSKSGTGGSGKNQSNNGMMGGPMGGPMGR